MAARMFTRGWDFFAPPQAVVYHLWSRGHRPSFRQVPVFVCPTSFGVRYLNTAAGTSQLVAVLRLLGL